jgi:hypothetical protein
MNTTSLARKQAAALIIGVGTVVLAFLQSVSVKSSSLPFMLLIIPAFCFTYIFWLKRKEKEDGLEVPQISANVKTAAHLTGLSAAGLQTIFWYLSGSHLWASNYVALYTLMCFAGFLLLIKDIRSWLKAQVTMRRLGIDGRSSAGQLLSSPWNKTFKIYGSFLGFGLAIAYLAGISFAHYLVLGAFLFALFCYIAYVKIVSSVFVEN